MLDEPPPPPVTVELRVGVYRIQVDELDQTEQTRKLQEARHRARGAAVKTEFSKADDVVVLDWDATDAPEPHELVELLVAVAMSPPVQGAAASVITWIGVKLADHAVDATISAGFKALARKIFRIHKAEPRVSDAYINTGPSRWPELSLYPPEWSGRNTVAAIYFEDGSRVEFHPPPGGWTGEPELDPPADRLKES